jgi:hypothetical protein
MASLYRCLRLQVCSLALLGINSHGGCGAYQEFNSWQETLYLLSNPANAEHLRQSIAEAQIGKTMLR